MENLLYRLLPTFEAFAHCDVPCGIYSVDPMKLAAATCLKMDQKIHDLTESGKQDPETRNNFVRMVLTKEEHARRCKEELLILWTDYFKPEHLEKYPDLHETFWKAAKQVSKVKQTVDVAEAEKLVAMVGEIGEIFAETQAAKS